MTGFGKAVTELPNLKITVEVKSLNSKQIDISTRMPLSCREIELDIRQAIASQLHRGKIDLIVAIEDTGSATVMHLDLPLLAAYKSQFEKMGRELGLPQPADWYSLLLRFPDAMKNDSESTTVDDERRALIMSTLDKALAGVTEFRRREGSRLEAFFKERIAAISKLLDSIEPFEQERTAKIKMRLEENLSQLNQVEIDRGRLEQEMIFYIEKLDVTEEKHRLRQHLSHFIETLDGEAGQGKKLGFIAQEMGREINTLGSKSNQADMQRIVVAMKDELEQIKEQVLNAL